MKLLIVDDSGIMRSALKKILSGTELELIGEAADGAKALELFRAHKPDVVTLDITMPEVDGLQALDQMKQIKPEAKIIIISALSDKATAVDAMNRGAEDYLVKPFTPEDVLEAVQQVMES